MVASERSRTIAVVGASLGGLRTVDALRREGWSERIVVIGDEPHLPYTRPPLTKKLLVEGGGDHATVALRIKESEQQTEWLLGRRVVSSDLVARELRLDDNSVIAYDGLVAATGVSSRRLPLAAGERLVVRTLEDSNRLATRLVPDASVVVIGAGFIGCEVAAAAQKRECRVAVVAIDDVPMQIPLGARVGAELRRRHELAGVEFHLGRGVADMDRAPSRSKVVLDDGTTLSADVVVEAIGSRPNVDWLADNGLDLTDGVLCDGALRMSGSTAAVAVGDIARFPNAFFGDEARRVEHWQIACDTATRAAKTLVRDLAGEPDDLPPFATVPTFWSDQGVVSIRSFGAPALGEESRVLEGDLSGEAAVGYFRDGSLVGIVLLGLAKEQGRFIAMINAALTPVPPVPAAS